MMTPNAERENERNAEFEFVEKLSDLVREYRTEIKMGSVIGALEIIKLTLYAQGSEIIAKEILKEGKSDDSRRES